MTPPLRSAVSSLAASFSATRKYPTRPTAVLFVASCPDLAAVVEQPLTNVLPDRVRPIQFDRIEALYLDTTGASSAFDPKQFARNLRQAHLLDGKPWLPGGAGVP